MQGEAADQDDDERDDGSGREEDEAANASFLLRPSLLARGAPIGGACPLVQPGAMRRDRVGESID